MTHNVLVIVQCSDGIRGIGEASSSLAMPEATPESMSETLRTLSGMVLGKPVSEWDEISHRFTKKFRSHPTALSSIECALLDAHCQSNQMSLANFFGGHHQTLETHFTIPALPAETCSKIAKRMIRRGFKKFKVKVTGAQASEDRKRIQRVSQIADGRPVLIDANQGWTPQSSLRHIEWLLKKKIPIELLEQPVRQEDLKGLKWLKKRSPVPIAVDESVKTLSDARKIVEEEAADIFNIKLAKMGLGESLRTARYLKKAGKKLMIGCMMESKIGLSMSVHWAVGSGDFDFIDLDSFLLLKELPIQGGFNHQGPFLSVDSDVLGLGITIRSKGMKP